ncbi:MAG TPA: PAS domain S-box protein [Gemmataceae bacterium]
MDNLRGHGRQYGIGYLLAFVATGVVLLVRRFVLADSLGPDAPLYLFLLAVVASAWFGGLKTGLLTTALSAIAGTYVFIVKDDGEFAHNLDALRIALFVLSGGAISWFAEVLHRSRERVDQQRESLRITLDSIGDAVITTDGEGRVTSMNPVAAALTGWTPGEAAGRPLEEVFRIINEWTRQNLENPVKRVLSEGRIIGLANHTLLIAKDGTERPIDDSAAPIRDAQGEIKGVVLIFRDMTERKHAERIRLQLAALVESSDDAIIGKDLDGVIRSWNRGAERLYGYAAEEAIGKPITLIIPPDHPDELPAILERLKRGERIEHYETVRVCKDGRRVDVSLSISPIKDENGRIIGASKIAHDITERNRLYQQLQEADRRKDEFLATLAHELRNPLAPIRNALQIMRLAHDNKKAVEQAQTVIERQLQQMVRLIDDLMDISRITRNKLKLHLERVELVTVLRHALEISRPVIEAAGHELTVTMPTEPLYVDADATRLAQVISNLLNNAAKYTEHGGRIWLTAGTEGNQAVVRVKDTGLGISAEHLPRIFEMFAQVEHSLERSQGGLGIGLTLVKHLTEMHGGTVEAQSEGRNKGSEFIVRLPEATAPAAQPQPSATTSEVKGSGERCKVLIVDDDEDTVTSMSMMLRIHGHDTHVARDGTEALEAARSFRPHIVLLDIALPKMNGYEVVRRIRQESWGKHMKLVALTGWGQEDDIRRSLEAGFDHHMTKPVEPAALEDLLKTLCPTSA